MDVSLGALIAQRTRDFRVQALHKQPVSTVLTVYANHTWTIIQLLLVFQKEAGSLPTGLRFQSRRSHN